MCRWYSILYGYMDKANNADALEAALNEFIAQQHAQYRGKHAAAEKAGEHAKAQFYRGFCHA